MYGTVSRPHSVSLRWDACCGGGSVHPHVIIVYDVLGVVLTLAQVRLHLGRQGQRVDVVVTHVLQNHKPAMKMGHKLS